jgi:hypothetical protein
MHITRGTRRHALAASIAAAITTLGFGGQARGAPPPPSDPLSAAMVANGFPEPSADQRVAFQGVCTAFENDEVAVINEVAAGGASAYTVAVAVGVLCPPQAARVGIAVMGNGDRVFPGFPLIVDVGTIDRRVAGWFEGELADDRVVALAPGVYAPYDPTVPNPVAYLDASTAGDCAVREQFFPHSVGPCWNGVRAGAAEPSVTIPTGD